MGMMWSGSYADTPGDAGPDEWAQVLAPAHSLSAAEADELARRWRQAMEHPRRVTLLTPLPRRTRLRLAIAHAIDGIGIWLVNRDHAAAAGRLWRITGRWTA